MILAGDIGGTKTLLGLYSTARDVKEPLRQNTYPSKKYDSLETIIAEFLGEAGEHPMSASFAVAGPVKQDVADITNLPWTVAAQDIRQKFQIPVVSLLNDVQAIAAAVPFLDLEDVAVLRPGEAQQGGTILIIAPGTGLGEAFLTWDGQRYRAHPTEGGHASFSPNTPNQVELLAYLYPRYGHLSCERVASGSGIPNVYEFLRDSGRYPEPAWLKEALAAAKDHTPVIVNAALEERADICEAALDFFVRILGGEVGNMALNVLATGGIYLGGGLPPRILSRLHQPDFLHAISHKGRFKSLLDDIPVNVILDREAALHGAAHDALAALEAEDAQ